VLEALLRTDVATTLPAVDICIVGAGVIGLALTRGLALNFPAKEIVLLEKNDQIGAETSSRNSEVIHAGIYYTPGSLKAALCIRGRELLYDYCQRRNIPYKRIGKLIVASNQESAALEQIQKRAWACGVESLQHLDRKQLQQMEPAVQADLALWSPDTGIVDSHRLMQQLLADAENAGATIVLRSQLLAADPLDSGGFRLQIRSGTEETVLHTGVLINCAGLHATEIARRISGLNTANIPDVEFIKGNYFSLGGRCPFSRLIYPVPDPLHRGLGVHATLDMAGQCRFGPDVELIPQVSAEQLDYAVDTGRAEAFAESIKRYYPAIDKSRLQPAYSGMRPRLRTENGQPADFLIQEPQANGLAGLWQLFGMESPGLTSSLAVADYVSARIGDY